MRIILTSIAIAALAACSSSAPVYYPPQPPRGADVPPQGSFQPNANLYACNMSMSNRPDIAADRRILSYAPLIVANGVILATAPVNDVCLTSGFGPRNGRPHKGIDLQARPAGTIYSAGPGIVLEVTVRTGFGNQVLIDHGGGVYTRYGHLASFAPALAAGQRIGFGQPLGLMGETGNATAIHLHFEILTGNYNTPQKSWGLKANNPLGFPAWNGLGSVS